MVLEEEIPKFAAWIVPSNSHSSQRAKLGLMLVHLKSSKLA